MDPVRIAAATSTPSPFPLSPPVGAGRNALAGWGLFALVLAILTLSSWLIYRWARIIFADEPTDKS